MQLILQLKTFLNHVKVTYILVSPTDIAPQLTNIKLKQRDQFTTKQKFNHLKIIKKSINRQRSDIWRAF